MPVGIDCAAPLSAKTAKALADAGYKFAARYLVPLGYAWKRLTPAEADAITAAGMYIISVFETAANRSGGGAAAGRADGAAAFREAQTVGQPSGSAIYFAVDYDAQPQHYDAIEAYLRAAAGQIPGYATGVYGSYAVIEEMARRGACSRFWQTYAWSRGKKSGRVHLYQYRNDVKVAGITVDLNESFGNEGGWTANKRGGTGGSENDEHSQAGDANESDEQANGGDTSVLAEEDAVKIIAFLQAAWKAATTETDRNEFHRLANEIRKAAGLPLT